MPKYKLSIFCPAYNHEKYIEECLESIVTQKTNFRFNLYALDDCSTDNTRAIILKYKELYPEIITPVFPDKNIAQHQGFYYLNMTVFTQLDCQYFLVNEGDDFFCDENKLQKQVDFLDSHPEFVGCFHPVKIIFENKPNKQRIYPNKELIGDRKSINFNDLLYTNYMQTNSVMYRWLFTPTSIQTEFPKNIMPGDLYLHLLHAKKGDFALLPEVMSVYRKHSTGIWQANRDGALVHQRFGRDEINFLENVYTRLTNNSHEYFMNGYLPLFTKIVKSHITYNNIKELDYIKENYKEYFDIAYANILKDKKKKTIKQIVFGSIIFFFLLFLFLFLK